MNLRTDKASVDTQKSWNDVIGQFDIQPYIRMDSASAPTRTEKRKKAQAVNNKKQQQPKVLSHSPSWFTRGAIVITCFATLGNIPFQSSITLQNAFGTSNFAIAIDATATPEQKKTSTTPEISLAKTSTAFQLDPEFQSLSLPARAIETYIGHQVINTDSKWASYTVKSYDNPANILHKVGLDSSVATLLRDNKIKTVLKKLKRDNIVRARSINGKLVELLLATSYKKAYVIKPSSDGFEGIWEGQWVDMLFEIRQARSSFVIRNGLFFDGKKAGVPGKTIRQIIKVFDWDIDFAHDIRVGDRVTLVYEEVFHDGDKVGSQNLLAAEFINKNKQFRTVRFTREDGKSDFFTPEGREMKRAFIRTPVAHARVSSHFNPGRFHPVLHKMRSHKGTDFAARRGTPIMATGNGTVKFIGRKGGYGRLITLTHREGYETRYGHMSKYKSNLKQGAKVYQGDIIGYVGSSGLATGPHCHYEFRKNGIAANPMTVKLPNSMSLTPTELASFRAKAINLVLQLNVLHRFATSNVNINSGTGG
ncbi:MAG TPA: peptidase M23 [Leucothrix mucor]|uniref:Peptidase M23 n=1 Tax=Leucothrix mucor TaxID=45248 RepID=A0A7V2T198_LEUMU|nr:peptidase M23 [Leucothrix mucor]